MDKETKRALCMTLAASLFVLLACCWALISGNATVNCRGFAVDADGNYYIGLRQRIDVYTGRERSGSIPLDTKSAYAFTIRDGHIVVATDTAVSELALDGTVIDSREDGGAAYKELKSLREYTAPDGQTYTMRFKPGFYSIVNANGDTVYASTSLDKMVVLCLPLDIIGTIWFTMFCFMRSSRLRRELQGAAE